LLQHSGHRLVVWDGFTSAYAGGCRPNPSPTNFWGLLFVNATVGSFTPSRYSIGYPLYHWAVLAYEVATAWPLFALTAKRLHDNGRSLTLAIPAAVAPPFAEAASLASDYGALDIVLAAVNGFPAILSLLRVGGVDVVHLSLAQQFRRQPIRAPTGRSIRRLKKAIRRSAQPARRSSTSFSTARTLNLIALSGWSGPALLGPIGAKQTAQRR
jgi:hypothetical protein